MDANYTIKMIAAALRDPDFNTDSIISLDKEELLELTPEQIEAEARRLYSTYCTDFDGDPAVYATTYGKYNAGRGLAGAWVKISICDDADEFWQIVKAVNYDDKDPEPMFTDYECFPEGWYAECLDDEIVERIIEYAGLDDNDKEIWEAYIDATGNSDADFSDAGNAYVGNYGSDEEFAEELFRECYEIPEHLESYIDWERVARDLMYDHFESNGRYFHA